MSKRYNLKLDRKEKVVVSDALITYIKEINRLFDTEKIKENEAYNFIGTAEELMEVIEQM